MSMPLLRRPARLSPAALLGLVSLAGTGALLSSCARCCDRAVAVTVSGGPMAAPKPAPATHPVAPGRDAAAAKAIHNYFRVSENLASGASPDTEEAFRALAAAGIRSIVSVDGAKPPADLARKHGLRYVHIPIGYDGISPAKTLEFAKTYAELHKSGPIFVHCHHGKHRGPAACSIGRIVLDGTSPEEAVAWMKVAGTAPKYKGLYETVLEFNAPSAADLAVIEAPMVEAAAVPAMQEAMVAVDHHFENLKIVKKAAWVATPDHPDVDPPHEATILAEQFREMARTDDVAKEPESFRTLLKVSEDAAWALAAALKKGAIDPPAAASFFAVIEKACTDCHKDYRDNTHRR